MSLRSIFSFDPNIVYSEGNFNLTLSFSVYDFFKLCLISILIISLNSNYNNYLGIIFYLFLLDWVFQEYTCLYIY